MKKNPDAPTRHWLIWWDVSQAQVEKEVKEYKKLKIYESSRGLSLLLIIFSVLITLLMVVTELIEAYVITDMIIFLILGFFIYIGHRWAIILAMIYWTIAKLSTTYTGVMTESTTTVIISVTFWAIYMGVFLTALKVENLRKAHKKELRTKHLKKAESALERLSRVIIVLMYPTLLCLYLYIGIYGHFQCFYNFQGLTYLASCTPNELTAAWLYTLSLPLWFITPDILFRTVIYILKGTGIFNKSHFGLLGFLQRTFTSKEN